MRHNLAFTGQEQLEFWNQKGKTNFLMEVKTYTNICSPRPFIVESLEEAWDRQSLIEKQHFAIANCTPSWTFNVQSFT